MHDDYESGVTDEFGQDEIEDEERNERKEKPKKKESGYESTDLFQGYGGSDIANIDLMGGMTTEHDLIGHAEKQNESYDISMPDYNIETGSKNKSKKDIDVFDPRNWG